ncbi:MAG TPA: hypothetical protein VKZ77_14505 [Bacillaceae bacterium]|nr:hypothetical protein [Bacillaceae bacterium]
MSNGEIVKVFFEQRAKGYRYEVEFENGHRYFYEQSEDAGYGGGTYELTGEEMMLARQSIDKYEEINGDATIPNNNGPKYLLGIILFLSSPERRLPLQAGEGLKPRDKGEMNFGWW